MKRLLFQISNNKCEYGEKRRDLLLKHRTTYINTLNGEWNREKTSSNFGLVGLFYGILALFGSLNAALSQFDKSLYVSRSSYLQIYISNVFVYS